MTNLFVAYLCKSCSVRGCSSLVRKLVSGNTSPTYAYCKLLRAPVPKATTICGRQMHVTLKASYHKPLASLIINYWRKKRWGPQ
jgi:hypothetical protein